MYVEPNFKTKKALKEAVARGEHVTVFDPGPFGRAPARVTLKEGRIVAVR